MAKKHIIEIGSYKYAVDSITAATQAVALLSKLKPVRLNYEADSSDDWFYEPVEESRCRDLNLKLNQKYREPKPEPKAKPLSLPSPKRGSIRCICDKSDVAPRQSCPHCGRPFSESHNRTHSSTSTQIHPTLRLL